MDRIVDYIKDWSLEVDTEDDNTESKEISKRANGVGDVQCIPPCTLVIPPYSLASPTTVSFPPLTVRMVQQYRTPRVIVTSTSTVDLWDVVVVTVTVTKPIPPGDYSHYLYSAKFY